MQPAPGSLISFFATLKTSRVSFFSKMHAMAFTPSMPSQQLHTHLQPAQDARLDAVGNGLSGLNVDGVVGQAQRRQLVVVLQRLADLLTYRPTLGNSVKLQLLQALMGVERNCKGGSAGFPNRILAQDQTLEVLPAFHHLGHSYGTLIFNCVMTCLELSHP